MKRLLDEGASELERTLLQSSDDAPSSSARSRALSAAVAATPGMGAGVASGIGHKLFSWSAVKLLSVLVCAGAIAVGATTLVRPAPPQEDQRMEVSHEQAVDIPAPMLSSRAIAQAAPGSAVLPPAPAPSATQAPTPSIAAELAVLDKARASLAGNDAAGALVLLDEHDREFPGGAFALEARVLRVHALIRLGRRDEAQAAAKPILEQAPNSVYARQVHDLLGS